MARWRGTMVMGIDKSTTTPTARTYIRISPNNPIRPKTPWIAIRRSGKKSGVEPIIYDIYQHDKRSRRRVGRRPMASRPCVLKKKGPTHHNMIYIYRINIIPPATLIAWLDEVMGSVDDCGNSTFKRIYGADIVIISCIHSHYLFAFWSFFIFIDGDSKFFEFSAKLL